MITPQNKNAALSKALDIPIDIYLKREDLHPYGSHKGRSIPIMIQHYIEQGYTNFCISSSGNAALAAALFVHTYNTEQKQNIRLKIFIGNKITPEKHQILQLSTGLSKAITLEQVKNPKQRAFQAEKENTYKNLRQSTDDTALIGYHALAEELAEIKDLSAVFIPTSSGTTAQGLYEGFKKHGLNPQIHIIQTPQCHPLVDNSPTGTSLAQAIIDTVGYRQQTIAHVLQKSKGHGWIASDDDILQAQQIVQKYEHIELSPNSALSIAGLQLARKNNWHFNGPVVCIITGR
jgi:threonine synthase